MLLKKESKNFLSESLFTMRGSSLPHVTSGLLDLSKAYELIHKTPPDYTHAIHNLFIINNLCHFKFDILRKTNTLLISSLAEKEKLFITLCEE